MIFFPELVWDAGCGSRDIPGLCGDIWAWLDRACSCVIDGYIDVLEWVEGE
ncbi:hypothetical protein [Bacillus thuringiensis]|uniref:hypothetical protein n=1 Tax=Bacillus thuringiensis TaxID=1428 RepID=UPI0015CF33F4|nr:hypothetical protein [Bacillus thuringiensis]